MNTEEFSEYFKDTEGLNKGMKVTFTNVKIDKSKWRIIVLHPKFINRILGRRMTINFPDVELSIEIESSFFLLKFLRYILGRA